MLEAVMLWNEPNNLSHWDFHLDPDWSRFAAMTKCAAQAVREENPELKIALGGISPIDPNFIELLGSYGVLDAVDVVAVHGFPLDWNHWSIHHWPENIAEIKRAAAHFPAGMGICQWFHFRDHRLQPAARWLREHGVRYLRTGISWADWFREGAEEWFDEQMEALDEFEVTLTLCFTPEHLGLAPHHTSPPKRNEDFAEFVTWAVRRYAPARRELSVQAGVE